MKIDTPWRAALVLILAPNSSNAQIVAHPNQVAGEHRIVNRDREILDALAANGLGAVSVTAISRPPAPFLFASTTAPADSPTHAAYELTVEGGTPGITYDVTLVPDVAGCLFCDGWTQASPPIEPEPAPDARLDFDGCLGLLRVQLVGPGGLPSGIPGGRIEAGFASLPLDDWGRATVLACAAPTPRTFSVVYTTVVDGNLVTHRVASPSFVVACDRSVDVAVTIPHPSSSSYGRIVGTIDVLGVAETPTTIVSGSGPDGNFRMDSLDRAPSSGPFALETLVPGTWTVGSAVRFDAFGREETLNLFPGVAQAAPGTTVDLGDYFVVDPTTVAGDLFLAGPPAGTSPWDPVLAEALGLISVSGTDRIPPGARASSAFLQCRRELDGSFDVASGEWSGDYRLLTGGPHGEASVQDFSLMLLDSRRLEDPLEASRWRTETLALHEPQDASVLIRPGGTVDLDHRWCMSEVRLRFESTGAPFFAPDVGGHGTLDGTDFEGRVRSHSYDVVATGVPADEAAAATEGAVVFTAPEGSLRLSPSATFVGPGGSLSRTAFAPVDLLLGCRQSLDAMQSIVAQVTRSPSCAGTQPIHLSGSVTADQPIASITWSANGAPPVDACRPCGLNPDFDVTILPPGGSLSVEIRAVDSIGRYATATVFADFAEEPSPLDRDPGAEPLRVTRDAAGRLAVTWGTAQGLGYDLYRGTIASLHELRSYDHSGFGACDLPLPRWSGADAPGSAYFLATSRCSFGNAPLGRDSFGREVPEALSRCP